jgi:hypothetical protein
VNLKRYTDNYTFSFLKFVAGLRPPSTSVTSAEQRFLADFAHGKRCIVEVGVFEAGTSKVFCREMDPDGTLYLVDPFVPTVRLERLLNVSFAQKVASKAVRPWQTRVKFVRRPSHVAATELSLQGKADFIFVDAIHEYDAVRQDFLCWAPMLTDDAVMAFHDSHPCPGRPEIVPDDGPARLMGEISQGKYGAWQVIGHVESVTAIKRRTGASA